jgi:hypothetical protein
MSHKFLTLFIIFSLLILFFKIVNIQAYSVICLAVDYFYHTFSIFQLKKFCLTFVNFFSFFVKFLS